MSLDQNLFTLHLTQNKENPNVVDLVDPAGTVYYRKQRLPGTDYKAEVYDPISQSLLITATSPAVTSKAKTLELCNPTIIVELKYTGTISFRWGFKWEEHEFEWKREECFMLRKPDPPVLVAVTKEPAGRLKTTSVQILDYNLNRFDIDDRKGLEIVILTALLTFQDVNEGYHTPQEASPVSTPGLGRQTSATPNTASMSSPPQPPPKPAPKTGVDRIAEMQRIRGEHNEVTVEEEGSIDHYAQYCARLLEDDAMLFVTVKSAAAEQVPRVLQVVEQTKRIRHKAGLSDGAELHQYVVYDMEKPKGPKRINLDDNAKPTTSYTPPTSLMVHLSKIDMPELQPKPSVSDRPSKELPVQHKTNKEVPSVVKASKDPKKKEDRKAARPTTPPSSSNPAAKLTKNTRSSSPNTHQRVHSHQVHLNQPSPSPSQLNNPAIYASPPPQRARVSSHLHTSTSGSGSISFPTPQVPALGTLNTGWQQPQRNSFHGGAIPQSLYGPGAYTPPVHPTPSSGGAHNPGYSPGYASQPPWQSPQSYSTGPSPPPLSPSHPSASTPATPSTHKPTSIVTGLFDSFRRR